MYQVKGLEAIQKILETLPETVARKMLKGVMAEALEPVRQQAQQYAPQGKHGDLKEKLAIVPNKVRDGKVSVNVRADREAYWGAMVEWGTRTQPPQGYMRRAFDSKGASAIEAVREGMERLVENGLGG